MEIEVQNARSLLPTLLTQLATEKDLEIRLQLIELITASLDDNVLAEVGADKIMKFLNKNFFNDKKFMRQFRIINNLSINPELAIEYLGEDYPSHPEFQYQSDVELKVAKLRSTLNIFCGKLIKTANKGESIEIS